MRLIDADLLKDAIEKEKNDNDYMCRLCLESTKEIIDEQPTAFDVDKVVDQLEKEESKARLELMEDRKTAFEFSSKSRLDAYKKALEIVKGGGAE